MRSEFASTVFVQIQLAWLTSVELLQIHTEKRAQISIYLT